MTICENIPGSAVVAHWRFATRTASIDIVLSMWFQMPPCVNPWILSVTFLKWKGRDTSSPKFVFVFLFTGVVLSTPGDVQIMAGARCQLLCPRQYRLCCSILSLGLRKCFPGKFAQISYSPMEDSPAHAGWTWRYNKSCQSHDFSPFCPIFCSGPWAPATCRGFGEFDHLAPRRRPGVEAALPRLLPRFRFAYFESF